MTTPTMCNSKTPQQKAKEIIDRVHSRVAGIGGWRNIYSSYPQLADAVERAPKQVPCPFTGDGKTKFRFRKKDLYTGCAIHNDFPVNTFVDGIDVLSHLLQLSKTETCKVILRDHFGDDISAPLTKADLQLNEEYKREVKASKILEPEEVAERAKKLEAVYHYTSQVTEDTSVGRYLKKRGLSRIFSNLPKDIGVNPRLYYWDNGKTVTYPGMIAVYRDNRGRRLTIHRTYLEVNGDKAKVDKPKLMMKPPADMHGGSIQLFEPHYNESTSTWLLGVSEGIENALSVIEATSMPCWAASSSWALENMEIPDYLLPPPDVKFINFYIWSDKDRPNSLGVCPGAEAASKLYTRMKAYLEGRYPASQLNIQVLEPEGQIPENKKGIDWNNVLVNEGSDGFPVRCAPELLMQLK
ncbi:MULTISPECIES: toprim domain-containing protein [Buttiauxella]|uniref:Uncharacterized protein conserved in bacteria n=1 Tax=Buttiauxella agrestis TaxID=82977 RepID=A0A381KNA9_9ENTR|nr:toprim domain-containing protein [Buttiauxella agrestis]SUY92778.1 Uncharacterized protein conserved in bacteria [Buttiauxella agrestis]